MTRDTHDMTGLLRFHLAQHVGRDNRISRARLVSLVTGQTESGPTSRADRTVREIIADLRDQGELICSDARGGYWMAESLGEVKDFAATLHKRAYDEITTAARILRAARAKFGGQTSLDDAKK